MVDDRIAPTIMKFGGSSVGSAASLLRVVDIIASRAAADTVVVVVSALAGVTDILERAARPVPDIDLPALLHRHRRLLQAVATGTAAGKAERMLQIRIAELRRLVGRGDRRWPARPAWQAAVLATGERLSAPILTAALATRGIDAVTVDGSEVVPTDSTYIDAAIDWGRTARRVDLLRILLAGGMTPVVTGHLGADHRGITTTLGRGGSDTTASVLGCVLGARRIEIWTDVDGIAARDPRHDPEARFRSWLSYAEADELAGAGARVLHVKSVPPAARHGIPLVVRNTFRPDAPGTQVSHRPEEPLIEENTTMPSIRIPRPVLTRIEAHAVTAYPFEGCGALFGPGPRDIRDMLLLPNTESDRPRTFFRIAPEDYLRAEGFADRHALRLLGFWHSHPDGSNRPSVSDRQHTCPGLLTCIIDMPGGRPGTLRAWTIAREDAPFTAARLTCAEIATGASTPLRSAGRTGPEGRP
ncbi:MAG: aspartate kinase [Acidobacteriota bacterium]